MNPITVKNVRRSYAGRPVLNGVNLTVGDGEFVSIVGQSGCGKSTLLNCIAGFLDCDGEISGRSRVGFVFQNHSLYPFMTCATNIALGLGHLSDSARRAKVAEYLSIVGLDSYGDRYPWQLSGGEAQRIAIARAFAPEPDVVLMDEPLSALDVMRREAMLEWLMTFLTARRTTIVMVTHWIDEAILPADRVIVLAGGVVDAEVPIDLPRPRADQVKITPEFIKLRSQIRGRIFRH